MINPLIIPILGRLREQSSSCSLVDLVSLCEHDFLLLIPRCVDPQIAIFQKNFLVMNALYQIQRDIQEEGFSLNISPLEISMIANRSGAKYAVATRDTALSSYYLNWSNLSGINVAGVEALFSSFWQRYRAVDKVAAALNTLGLNQNAAWSEIRHAYQKKIIISHPDKGGCAEDFIDIREAYEVLSINYH